MPVNLTLKDRNKFYLFKVIACRHSSKTRRNKYQILQDEFEIKLSHSHLVYLIQAGKLKLSNYRRLHTYSASRAALRQ